MVNTWHSSARKTTSDSDIFLYEAASKDMKLITSHQGAVSNTPQSFDPESRYLYYTSNESGEFTSLERYELSTGKKEHVEKSNWDVTFCYFSESGKYRVVGTNEDARTKVSVFVEGTSQQVTLPNLGEGDINSVQISPSENKMAFYFSGSRSPANLYVYDFGAKKLTRLTDTLNPALDAKDLVESEVVRYQSFDNLTIPAILYRPHQASAVAQAPAIVMVHGGPGG